MKKLLYSLIFFGATALLLSFNSYAQETHQNLKNNLDAAISAKANTDIVFNPFIRFDDVFERFPFLNTTLYESSVFARDIKQAMDSISNMVYDTVSGTFIPMGYYLFDYNNEGKQILEAVYQYDESSGLTFPFYKYTYEHDDYGFLTLQYLYMADTASLWTLMAKQTYAYDASGNQTESIAYGWNAVSEVWMPGTREVNEYNQENLMVRYTRYDWDATTEQWVGDRQREYTYNAQNLLSLEVASNWDEVNSAWIYSYRGEFTYLPDGQISVRITYIYDALSAEWIYSSKSEYSYDPSGNHTQSKHLYWDTELLHWVNLSLYEYSFDEPTRFYQQIYSVWRPDLNEWEPEERNDNYFDEFFNPESFEEYFWDTEILDWEPDEKTLFAYNPDYTLDDLILPYLLQADVPYFVNMLEKVEELYWLPETDEWIHDYTNAYHYKPIDIVNVAENKESVFRVYPNPASNQITIESTELTSTTSFALYDLQGRVILEKSFLQPVSIQVSDLSPGLYIYQVNCGNALETGKILIR